MRKIIEKIKEYKKNCYTREYKKTQAFFKNNTAANLRVIAIQRINFPKTYV